jgi:hypothetical protein
MNDRLTGSLELSKTRTGFQTVFESVSVFGQPTCSSDHAARNRSLLIARFNADWRAGRRH